MARLRALGYTNSHTLAYQSRLGPVQWLQPYTDEKIRELGGAGTTKMVVVPVSFVSEHIETLEEIDMEYAELAEECGITQWERVPTIGLDGEFIDDLADAVIEALPKMDEPPTPRSTRGGPSRLRVVNDLVQLRGRRRTLEIDEFGPVRYNAPQRVGFTPARGAHQRADRDGGDHRGVGALDLAGELLGPRPRRGAAVPVLVSRVVKFR